MARGRWEAWNKINTIRPTLRHHVLSRGSLVRPQRTRLVLPWASHLRGQSPETCDKLRRERCTDRHSWTALFRPLQRMETNVCLRSCLVLLPDLTRLLLLLGCLMISVHKMGRMGSINSALETQRTEHCASKKSAGDCPSAHRPRRLCFVVCEGTPWCWNKRLRDENRGQKRWRTGNETWQRRGTFFPVAPLYMR
jgi:hypothetical protein